MAFLRSVKSRRGIFAGGITYKGGMDSTKRRNLQLAGWLVARVSLMLAYAKTWHLKE
ncbi:hypothetical protein ACM4EZ_004241 [Escherichia coli]|uniref:hypothetical protein n=1 Tax=Escherichia coli TaxID=562 RepID=UPI000DA4CB99|nr:hypothetical protein [Escherichia coli]SQP92441.1 Uncharacterised protein [Escherichia coli]